MRRILCPNVRFPFTATTNQICRFRGRRVSDRLTSTRALNLPARRAFSVASTPYERQKWGETMRLPPAPSYDSSEAERLIADVLRSGDRVYLHTAAACPQRLVRALGALKGHVTGVEVTHMHTEGAADYLEDSNVPTTNGLPTKRLPSFIDNSLFIGANVRDAVNCGNNAEFTPVFFSEVPRLFRRGHMPIDLALVSVSPPDSHGFVSLGTSVDCSLAAVQSARRVICQVNKHMPRTHGDGFIHISKVTAMIRHDEPLPEHKPEIGTQQLYSIGENVASLIPDGATLQMGIGAIPDAVLRCLTNHQQLGVHTEMFSDGLLPLVQMGVVNGSNKSIHPNTLAATFLMGSRELYDFVDDNPLVKMLDVEYLNNPNVIARNPMVHAINSAIEIDLTGQVCADSIGTKLYSGIGGQMDFMRGAALSAGGKPIIAMPSQTAKGQSRIVPHLQTGAGVTVTRNHIWYVVTEYGVASLHGRTVRQRALALAAIAHPKHRDMLRFEIEKRWGALPTYLTHPPPPWSVATPGVGIANGTPVPSGDTGRTDSSISAREYYANDWH